MKTVKLKFITDAGKNFNLSLNYASEALSGAGAAELVNTAMDALISQQPFIQKLASKNGAELINRNVKTIVE